MLPTLVWAIRINMSQFLPGVVYVTHDPVTKSTFSTPAWIDILDRGYIEAVVKDLARLSPELFVDGVLTVEDKYTVHLDGTLGGGTSGEIAEALDRQPYTYPHRQ